MTVRIAWLLALACCAAAPVAAQDISLAPGPGKDVTEAGCATCHTLNYIPMNSRFMSPDVWKAEVTKMRAAFGAPIDDEAAAAIITYLVANYGAPAK